jgi:hypothetical protein
MKEVSEVIGKFNQADIATIERDGRCMLALAGGPSELCSRRLKSFPRIFRAGW